MTHRVIRYLTLVAVLAVVAAAPKEKSKPKTPCAPSIAACPDQGCGGELDEFLNRRKNIRSDNQTATPRTLAWIKKLDDPEHFTENESREELAALGEGQMISVVAYVIEAKAELGGESCNCHLQTKETTDNHLVLVTKATVDKFPITGNKKTDKNVFQSRERESITAEFTPRVRASHPHFTRETVQPLIDDSPQQALLVRVTGLLMFDSEHFIRNALPRVTNWEIHPVFKFEVCPKGKKCTAGSDANWQSVDDLP